MSEDGFIHQVMQRRVARALSMYLVGSFVALQVGDVAFEPLGLPDWSVTALITILAIGLPIVLVLAWIFDLTPIGIVRTPDDAVSLRQFGPVQIIEILLVLSLTLALGYFLTREFGTSSNAGVVDRSVAVLPFASIGTLDSYLADGITAELTDSLAAIPDIRIASYDSRSVPLADRELAATLNVSHLIKGTVQMVDDSIRTRVQLVRAYDSGVLWSFQSDKTSDNLFEIQDDIAKNVAVFLKSTLYKEALARRALNQTDNPQAYEAYLLALHYRTINWPSVIEYAERAISLDPEFVPAYALLANVYMSRVGGSLPAAQAHSLARQRLETALQLDAQYVPALKIQAHLERIDQNYAAAEELFRRAKALAPNEPTRDLANLLFMLGRLEEALDEYHRSLEIDPIYPGFYTGALFASRNYKEAIAHQLDEFETASDRWRAGGSAVLAQWYAFLGNEQEANRFIDAANQALTPSMHFAHGYLAYALARTGQNDRAMEIIKQLEAEQDKRYVSPSALFWAYLGVRDLDRAFLWLNRVIDENVYIVTVGLLTSPLFDELRKDLRFVSALDRLGLYKE